MLLQKYFESPNVLDYTLKNIEQIKSNGNLNHYIMGHLWKSKMENFGDKIVFPIFVYFDDFQINDALLLAYFGNEASLKPLIDVLEDLSINGLNFEINGQTTTI